MENPDMSKRLITIITLVIISAVALSSCAQQKKEILPSQMAPVTRGDLILSVSSDGNLEMPHDAALQFNVNGTVKEIYVAKGSVVKAGTLLAKLDNKIQILSVKAAQYAVELALNSVIQGCCGPRYPTFYSMATALMRFEQAQDEVGKARELVSASKYADAASNISLAKYDLDAARSVYANPELDTFQTQYNDMNQPTPLFPELIRIAGVLDTQIAALKNVRQLLEAGDYPGTSQELEMISISLDETHSLIKQNSRLPGVYTYPDTSTSLAISRQVLDALSELQLILAQDDFDRIKASEKLRMAEHDLLMSNMILNESETIYRAGLNPQTLRTYNINIETAMINLDKAKKGLLDTEIIAPFDGIIDAIHVKKDENNQTTLNPLMTKIAIHIVDTKTIKMTGIIDEIDITRVAVGQEAVLTVDALPGQKLKGSVRFVSPFGTLQSGVVNFPVEIYLDKTENVDLLRGGLTATADIITGKRENVLQVPNRAIKGLAGDFWVDVVTNASTAATEKRPVKTGLQNKKSTEIISGLKEGEQVLIEAIK
jgi:HlyD family secretion protein